MKIVKKIVIAIVVLIILALVIGFFSPRNVTLERSISIDASPASIYEEINGFKSFNKWSPWAKIDPENTDYTYDGPDTGVGSKMSWTSTNDQVGVGSQEIVESIPNEKVRTMLIFGDYPDPNYANFIITGDGESSAVLWTFEGDMGSNPIGKLFGLFMESMLGPSYEEGLQNLKSLVESKPKYTIEISVEEVEPITYLGINNTFDLTANPEAVSSKIGELYGKIGAYMASKKIEFSGMPLSVYNELSESSWNADLGIPCKAESAVPSGDIIVSSTTGGKVVKGIHMGNYYDQLEASHNQVQKYMEYNGLEASGNPYEIYVSDPMNEPDTAKWITEVFYPIK